MIRRMSWAIIALFCLTATTVTWAVEPAVAPETAVTQAKGTDYIYPLVLATGALAGVLTVNAMTYSIGSLPLSIGMPSTAPMVSPAAAAASRIFVITSGIFGAWIADALYTTATH